MNFNVDLKTLTTDRQFDIIEGLVFSGTKKEAANILGISVRTLETHIKNIYAILYISHVTELVLIYTAYKYGIAKELLNDKTQVLEKHKEKIASFPILIFFLFHLSFTGHEDFVQRRRRIYREYESEQVEFIANTEGS